MSQLLFWGDSTCGEFGPQTSTSPVSWTVPGVVTNICCGDQHVLFLLDDGTVLSQGSNSRRQLGRKVLKNVKSSGRVQGLGAVVSLACGQNHSLALCASGRVYSWGAEEDGQLGLLPNSLYDDEKATLVHIAIPIPVIQVACGNSHSLALTKGGDVLSWGLNSHGQLGAGKDCSMWYRPLLVRALNGIPVTHISAGGAHTLFLTLSGLVYCCGANKHGQLGLNRVDEKGRFNICVVPALRCLSVSSITCGENHSAVRTKEGKVYTFGEGAHGQLGHSSSADEVMPKLVTGIDGCASQVACGRIVYKILNSLVLGSSGQLWAFGNGVKGQIGNGKPEGCQTPTLVQLPWNSDTHKDLKIAAGWNTSFAFSSPQGGKQRQITGRLDEAKLRKWLALKKSRPEPESEIIEMFLTSSSLVASFTKATGLSLAADALNVDLDAASQTFSQMLAVPWIQKKVDLSALMEILLVSRASLKSPEIVVVLLSCPLFQDVSQVLALVLPLAVAITDMSEKCQTTLKSWWASLSATMLLKHILVFKNALDFVTKNLLLETHVTGVKATMEVIKLLFKANKRGKSYKVPLSTFYVSDITYRELVEHAILWLAFNNQEDDSNTPAIFCLYPFLLSLHCKRMVFNVIAMLTKMQRVPVVGLRPFVAEEQDSSSVFLLFLRPSNLLEDTFRQLNAADHSVFRRQLQVHFVDDREVMHVNTMDLFFHVFDELMAPQSNLFIYNESHTLAWFPPKPKVSERTYFLFGVLCGLALYNHVMVYLPFPLIVFKKMLGVKASLDDLKEFEPAVGESLRCILEDYSADVLHDMATTFTVTWAGDEVELDSSDPAKLVTGSNKKEFVAAFVDYVFNKSVKDVFEVFKRGFLKVCDADVVAFFQPEELQAVMVGNENYDWDVFKQNTVYEGEYHAEHLNIVTFWEVFDKLTVEEKKKFLLFLTGSDRVPTDGMASIKMRVAMLPNSTDRHFPEATTCHHLLLLPMYQRYPAERTMYTMLLYAINYNRGFSKTFNTEG
uniref:probable E3 ubiquitin-protein ligase HERC4 n=1 Tax=Doryrhamphus excisus TaxID=161450 RepID=UPI0025AE4CB6|nr:probable E3 ubiquitin-protein ligase HERC4 [Doryrhamphus excisus]